MFDGELGLARVEILHLQRYGRAGETFKKIVFRSFPKMPSVRRALAYSPKLLVRTGVVRRTRLLTRSMNASRGTGCCSSRFH